MIPKEILNMSKRRDSFQQFYHMPECTSSLQGVIYQKADYSNMIDRTSKQAVCGGLSAVTIPLDVLRKNEASETTGRIDIYTWKPI